MVEVHEAERLISEHMPAWPSEEVPLELAIDRILAADVLAERDLPSFDRVTMDGIAIDYAAFRDGIRQFKISGIQPAGVPRSAIIARDECVRVMTGAICPGGANTVIPIERLQFDGNRASIAAGAHVEARQFVHPRGSDRPKGAVTLASGVRLGPPEIAVLAANGCACVRVARLPLVAVVSTGDELVGVDDPLQPYQIRSSNGRAIEAALTRRHLAQTARVRLRDNEQIMLEAIAALHSRNDALILSGGVSMGDFDFVPAALERLGAELVFHRVNQKPGRPMWFGLSRDRKPIFALPGNPVSTLVCVARYVAPAFERALGSTNHRTERVELAAEAADGPAGMSWFVPVRLEWHAEGTALAYPCRINTSGDFSSLAGTDGIVELAADERARAEGARAALYRW
jgi:molybdopterin molybdotransferase